MGSAQKQPSRVTVSDSKRLRKPNKIHGCSTRELLGRGCRALSTNLPDHPSWGMQAQGHTLYKLPSSQTMGHS